MLSLKLIIYTGRPQQGEGRARAVADPGVDPHGTKEPPFGLDLVLRNTDDRLNGTTLSG